MDRRARLKGGVAVVLHLRSSHGQVAGDLLKRRALHQRHFQGSTRQCCRGVERIRASRHAVTIFPLTASYRFCGDQGCPAGSRWSSARPEARGWGVQEGEEGKRTKKSERVVGKAAGDVCILGEGLGWQMRLGPTPCWTRRAVRTVTGSLDWTP